MKLKQISKWFSYEAMNSLLKNKVIKSWLLEEGPITKRIKSSEKFELKLLQDDLGDINKSDRSFIGHLSGDIKIREVILYGNKNPRVFAQSIIPVETINRGLSKLGELGTKPLGDILFEKNIFKKKEILYSSFRGEFLKHYWGRKTKYLVNKLPFSVMEVFLIEHIQFKD